MANQLDQFNIKMIYPTRAGGREWFLKDSVEDIMGDSRGSGDMEDDIAAGGNSTDGFTVMDNSQVRLGAAPDNSDPDPSNENLDQSQAKGRGYAFTANDWVSVEVTARIKCTDQDSSDSRFILKGPTGSHHSNSVDCSGSSYGCRFFLPASGSHAGKVQFHKEQYHVHYVSKPDSPVDSGQGHIFNQWVVCKYMCYRVRNAENTEDHMRIEAWLNKNNDGVTFVKILELVDSGGWGDDATQCGADRDDEIMTWGNGRILFRWDGPAIIFKDLSVREIDTTGSAGEPELPPTTGTISRDWIIKYNLISFPQDACGLGQSSSELTEFYNVTDNGSASNLHRDRYRVAVLANGSASTVIGKKPKRVVLRLSKTGNPPSGNVTCVLRKGSDDSVAVTYTWTGGTLNATALTTGKLDYTFEMLTNNYAWVNGDRLCVEYSGNTVDTTNEVNVYRSTLNPFDGNTTCASKFESGGPPPTAWSAPDTSRDYAWIISE